MFLSNCFKTIPVVMMALYCGSMKIGILKIFVQSETKLLEEYVIAIYGPHV